MHITEIVLDGFKSYGHRTEITGFDNEFNAITGLNGTGKSNILDSICFVLGISNLSLVRAGSMTDFIYKSGQAGVSKATVSITFDNKDKRQSPVGFEEYNEIVVTRQVVMGGRNKYMLNGSVVPNKRVQDLFCSVQLNVNNPHFLIMQGRITKVLSMKPREILAMVEEAAGTRMYEMKRQAAQKTIEKKEAKLLELEKINQEEIGPKLNRLREERSAYLEYQRIERELEHLFALFQAWQYLAFQKNCVNAEKALRKGENQVKDIENDIANNITQAEAIDAEVEEMTKILNDASGGKLQEYEKELKENEKLQAKACAAEKTSKENIASEEKKKKQLEKNLKDDESVLKSKEQELSNIQGLFEQLKSTDAADNQAFALSQKKYEAITMGMEVNDTGETETLQDQLMNAKQQATEANAQIKQANIQLASVQKLWKEKQRDFNSNASEYQRDKNSLKNMEKEIQSLEKDLDKLSYSEEQMNELRNRRQVLLNEIRTLHEKIERFRAQNPSSNFQYRDPETNFDRNSVNGVVCRLLKLKERKAGIAIETAAGGRLYNVVVDTDTTSKKLLQRGNLQNRTTFIPLNKIQTGKISQNTINFAQNLVGKENVQPALSLISYDKHLQPAMEFIFGTVFICKDLQIARQVTYHEKIKCKCVTLDGDVTNPWGTLSGGAKQKSASILIQLEEITECEKTLRTKEKELRDVENTIRELSAVQEQWRSTKQQLELKQHELDTYNQRLQNTSHHMKQDEIDNMKQKIDELTANIHNYTEIETVNNKKAKEIEHKIKDYEGHRQRGLKEAEQEMNKLKKKAENSRKNWKQREQDYETLNLEISELKTAIQNGKDQIVAIEQNIVQLQGTLAEGKKQVEEITKIVTELQQTCKQEKAAISDKNKQIQKKINKKEQLIAQVAELELEIKKKKHEIKKLQDDFKTSQNRQAECAKKDHDPKNIRSAQELSDGEAKELEKKIRNFQEKRTTLGRTVNAKAQSMFEHEEKQYNQLLKKKAIVESDKRKLLLIMKDLDKKKVDTIITAYNQVNKDFGSIFSTLLPGSNAKLQESANQTVLEGLEIRVFIGGIWKESLSELSGGQRSLAALSLILAMLLFKPAPLYILDEIDSALDLSHTQNIGNMLKTHFKQSQFIIVSLKDGMFSNANVLFRTKLVDGASAVTRTVNRSAR